MVWKMHRVNLFHQLHLDLRQMHLQLAHLLTAFCIITWHCWRWRKEHVCNSNEGEGSGPTNSFPSLALPSLCLSRRPAPSGSNLAHGALRYRHSGSECHVLMEESTEIAWARTPGSTHLIRVSGNKSRSLLMHLNSNDSSFPNIFDWYFTRI